MKEEIISNENPKVSSLSSIKDNILKSIKESLTLNDQDQLEEDSKASITTTSSSSLSINNEENNFLNTFEYLTFEEDYRKYFVDSTKNVNGNFDFYVTNALKLISLIPLDKLSIPSKIKAISKELEKQFKKYLLPNTEQDSEILNTKTQNQKKTLILDLDETLIHSDMNYIMDQEKTQYDIILHFDTNEEKNIPLPVIFRPGLFEFLDYASKEFELIVFTASDPLYADTIINYLERNKKYFKMRLYRNHCLFIEPGLIIKDLRIFTPFRKMEDMIIVDNSLFSFGNQLNNGILVTSFFDDKEDNFLSNLEGYLDYIKTQQDIREVNKESFKFEEYKHDIIINSDN